MGTIYGSSFSGRDEKIQAADGLSAIILDGVFGGECRSQCSGGDVLKLKIQLCGRSRLRFAGEADRELDCAGQALFLVNLPHVEAKEEWIEAGTKERSVTLAIPYIGGRDASLWNEDDVACSSAVRSILDRALWRKLRLPDVVRHSAAAILDQCAPVNFREQFIKTKVEEMACLLLEAIVAPYQVRHSAALSPRDTRRVLGAMELIESNLGSPLSVGELSRAVGVNRNKLSQGFKDLFGGTVHQVVVRRRLMWAQQMLLEGTSVGEVAERCGYSQVSNFSSAFRAHFGLSPSQARSSAARAR